MDRLTEWILILTENRPITLEGAFVELIYLLPILVGIFDDIFKSRERDLGAQVQWLLLLALAPVFYGWTIFLYRFVILFEPALPASASALIGGYSGFVRLRRLYREGWIR